MAKQIIIAEQHRLAAVFSEDQIQELVVATGSHQVGDIYLGVVENVLPGIDAAFVNIGDAERNGFIHVTDLGPLRLKRRAGAITELLAPQQKVLVQVMKEPTGNKGPRLTGNLSLPGRYLVLMPYGRGVNLSRRIRSDSERNRLRALAVLIKPAGMGLLVRTEAEGRAEEAIMEDLEALQKQWEAVQQEATSSRAPALLNRDDDFIQRVLRDMYTADVNRIVVDSHTGVKRVKQQLVSWSGGRNPEGVLIDHHRDRLPILDYFRVNAAIREALKPRVDLPSGGYIIIQPTEALTVIDVNSGSFTRSATARETVLWTNCEAATEIARQLRLRNVAGVIVVDFIDMDSRRDQLQVLEHFNKALRVDKARPQIAQLSELGLVELTRKRQGQNIYELFGSPCSTCGGFGHLVHLPGETESTAKEKEIVEPAVRIELREPTTSEMPETFDIPTFNEPDELDLLHHPSYQERGGVNGVNRRRRRRRLDEVGAKEEPVTKSVRPTPVPQGLPEPTVELDSISEPSRESIPGRPVLSDSAERPGKPQLIKSSVEIEKPEVIAVEMTPEEQDIYALMGISPLVRLEREIKYPRAAIISVVLPGEGDRTSNSNEAAVESFTEASSFEEGLDEAETSESETVEVTSAIEASDTDTELATNQTSTSESDTPAPESDTPAPVIRRRRRRSSAIDSEESTA
ncbi:MULTISPECIES: Rne/Rng family ribonuclease [unclassified Coleofasciculus]|uniref:Rne/Rng family ribonuclease n=1 Tax=unclassified Coleofasciculus TaxID=2692782 RepID=UPI00188044E9|nr:MULTISPECIES: Rne/Rng family ribonuclease [unclassified Coleofasciculus]MBE9130164.1 Rne/Rng family ribonuclease [Coleofasciculus sp. LEGE 07081]MBE9150324.1 Rne/Rng family ribonuclease [Coleofasciculus sp. LEGE 07092]